VNQNGTARVVVTTPVPAVVLDHLAEHVDVIDVSAQPRDTWRPALASARGLLVNSQVKVDRALLDAAPALKIVASVSVGVDNIDRPALAAREILLSNSRGSLIEAVADLSYGLIIMAMRRLAYGMYWIRSGRWMTGGDAPYGRDLAGATLGIVGLGDIGSALVRRAHASEMRVIYTNRTPRADDATIGATYRPFDTLLAEADCVIALVPLTSQTRGLFNDAAFAKMKPDAVLVNAARGPVVDTASLLRALDEKRIAGAVLDVTDPEPLPPDHPLLARNDVLVVPHVGSATIETRTRMAMLAADNILAALDEKPLLTAVATS
jgi:glyoxylate reductase